jgi:integrase
VEALLRAVDLEHEWWSTEHALCLTAAMTGLRQGELLALRWRDSRTRSSSFYADYAPSAHERAMVEAAFARRVGVRVPWTA